MVNKRVNSDQAESGLWITYYIKNKIGSAVQIHEAFCQNKTAKSAIKLINFWLDLTPWASLIKNTPVFIKSLKSDKWKNEILKFTGVLWSTPFEAIFWYDFLTEYNSESMFIYGTVSKCIYWPLYIAYIYKKEDINLTEIIKKWANNLDFNTRLHVAIMMDEFDNICNDNENISKIRSNIQNFPKNFNLKKKL